MAFSDMEELFNESILQCFIEEKSPPKELHNKLQLLYKIENQSVIIYEQRPHWKEEGLFTESGIAKATYVKAKQLWKVYWRRADLKWHLYEPAEEVDTLEEFLAVVKEDYYGCFWG